MKKYKSLFQEGSKIKIIPDSPTDFSEMEDYFNDEDIDFIITRSQGEKCFIVNLPLGFSKNRFISILTNLFNFDVN